MWLFVSDLSWCGTKVAFFVSIFFAGVFFSSIHDISHSAVIARHCVSAFLKEFLLSSGWNDTNSIINEELPTVTFSSSNESPNVRLQPVLF